MRAPLPSALAAAAGVLAAAALTFGGATVQNVKIVAREFAFEPKEVMARPGDVIFTIHNAGAIEHNFLVDDAAKKTVIKVAVIAPGESEEVRVGVRAGTYAIYCDLPGHREAGMAAVLRVRE
ncbi:MAG: cupredoxin domain-containing protein [Armatimonadota bacterium]|nr:cupredoxin domain-containing protein [Armatimonadota bacterium]MDR7450929.1 cupredoxin domain-containing protein [Armatimonadota bacterium]MDR7465851.1 cupredoxin domain-containing protein [Armatimonadota bacterium]MDR7493759.1 cupredoxin domain-containing protein [Armatimonadota bacterium]MDR7498365.1 cupredoxin domain-containing protein [Armatimonadota bacterium]